MKTNVTIIAGATASGKSARAIELALQRNAVIINADSQQLYKALPILTAQPSIDDLNSAPHLLYGILDHHEQWSAATWANNCADLIRDLWNQNKHPIIVGGTGFYIKALLDGFSPLPDVPPEYRTNGNEAFKQHGAEKFYADLIKDDPLIEGRLNPNDKQRLIRAREVFDYTKQSIIEWQAKPNIPILPEAIFDIEIISLPRDILYARCEKRIQVMLDQGVMDEVMKLYADLETLKTPTAPVTKALGYHEFSNYGLGNMSLDDAIEKTALLTRHYAKRQVTWFKNQMAYSIPTAAV